MALFSPLRWGLRRWLSHLQFAADTMFFYSGNENSFIILSHILGFSRRCWGLKLTRANVKFWELTVIKINFADGRTWVDYKVGSFPSSYLGLPLGGNLRAISFWDAPLKKIRKRLVSWKKSLFSKARRLTLIRCCGIPIYYFSLFSMLLLQFAK